MYCIEYYHFPINIQKLYVAYNYKNNHSIDLVKSCFIEINSAIFCECFRSIYQ